MADAFHPLAMAQHAANWWRRINYDPIQHNAIRLRHQGISPRDAILLAKILAPNSTYNDRSFDTITPEQNANLMAMLKQMGYLQQQAL